jgi:hypothetical protein
MCPESVTYIANPSEYVAKEAQHAEDTWERMKLKPTFEAMQGQRLSNAED